MLAAKAVHARQKPNRVARILVLKILYSLEPAGTEWPAALLWGTTPSGPPAWASHHEKYTGRGPSGATADRVVLKRTQLRAACVFKPRQRPARTCLRLWHPETCQAARPATYCKCNTCPRATPCLHPALPPPHPPPNPTTPSAPPTPPQHHLTTPLDNTKATIKNNRCVQSTSCFTNYPSFIT